MEDTSKTLPWAQKAAHKDRAPQIDIDTVVESLIQELKDRHAAKSQLTPSQTKQLQKEFDHAKQGETYAKKFMLKLAALMKIECPQAAAHTGPTKSWDRAAAKMSIEDRNLHDLQRGRLYVQSPKDIAKFYKLLNSKDNEGHIPGTTRNVVIIPDSIDDYIKNPRKSGFAGAIIMDLGINIGKNRIGTYELQIMPRDYKDVYDQSHHLYEMIRILQEIPKNFLSEEHNYVIKNLVMANTALWDEFAIRTGFDTLRSKPLMEIDKKDWKACLSVLDQIWRTLYKNRNGKNPWIMDMEDSVSLSKTSVTNMYIASEKNPQPDHDADNVSTLALT
jgi:hypothetical protein